MNIKNNAFSLIEVIIATAIISITVFGVYRLIGENTKIINNSGNYLQINSLFPVMEQCIENIGYEYFYNTYEDDGTTDYYLKFGNNNDSCLTGTTSDSVIIDNIDYFLNGEIKMSIPEYINWELKISSDQNKIQTLLYKQLKK